MSTAPIVEKVWNPQSLGSKMAVLYADDKTLLDLVSDIVIVVGHKEYNLHKIILSATSEAFRGMCCFSTSTSPKDTVPLFETEECAAVFEDFVEYIYTGNINLDMATVDAIITLANKYQVEDLEKIAKQFQKKMNQVCSENIISI